MQAYYVYLCQRATGKQFALPVWEAAVQTMTEGERALFGINHPDVRRRVH